MQDEVATSCDKKNVETDDSDSEERSDSSSYVRIVDPAYKKRVMDDLDALLADLQSTTAHISSYQSTQLQQQQQPPPPPPSNGNQRTYHHQQDRQPYSNNHNGSNNIHNDGGVHYSQQQHHQQQQQHYPPPPPPQQQQHYSQQQQQPPLQNLHLYTAQPYNANPHQQHHHLTPPSATTPTSGTTTTTNVYYTLQNVSAEEQGQGYGPYHSGGEEDATVNASGSSTPPPLPPPPPSEVLDSLAHAQRREIVSLHQPHHPHPGNTSPPPPAAFQEQHQRHQSVSSDFDSGGGVQTRSEVKGRGERMSALSNNLSELDQLLQDLNSAQFMAEVDRKSSVNDIPVMMNGIGTNNNNNTNFGGNKPPPPQVAPKPKRSVDSLLDELELTPTPKFPVDPSYQVDSSYQVDPAYQELGPPTTNHAQHHPFPASSSSSSSSSSFPHQSASSATKELDDLMMSLSEFKVQDKDELVVGVGGGGVVTGEPTYARPVKSRNNSATSPMSPHGHSSSSPSAVAVHHGPNMSSATSTTTSSSGNNTQQLDSMLGDLQSDMTRQGVNTKQKGVCAACSKPIVGQVIAALGQTWHIEHFTCAHCEEPLGTRNFYERDGMAYCETDYHHLFAPRCAYCNGPIVDKCITALGKMWHPEHFFCAQCGHPFGEEDFHEKNGKAYCRDDYFAMFAPKCGGCAHPIMENYISALNRQWHPECFVCWDCRSPFGTGSFFDYEGLPYCETHYHAKKGSLCASCEKPITGRCITAMFKKFHPEHFVCAFCLKQLNKGTFKEQNDKPYCHPCFVKLFG